MQSSGELDSPCVARSEPVLAAESAGAMNSHCVRAFKVAAAEVPVTGPNQPPNRSNAMVARDIARFAAVRAAERAVKMRGFKMCETVEGLADQLLDDAPMAA